jgi:hypothetical protein
MSYRASNSQIHRVHHPYTLGRVEPLVLVLYQLVEIALKMRFNQGGRKVESPLLADCSRIQQPNYRSPDVRSYIT